MRIAPIALTLLMAVSTFGANAKLDLTKLAPMLEQTWANHDANDQQRLEEFQRIVDRLKQVPEIDTKLHSYAEMFKLTDPTALARGIFLLRRHADKVSFYAAISKWHCLDEATKNLIVAHIGPTYNSIANDSLEANRAVVASLQGRHANNQAAVAKSLPPAFHSVVDDLNGDVLIRYLDLLTHVLSNSVAVRAFVETPAPSKTPKDKN